MLVTMGVDCERNESKCEMLSPVTHCSTLDELQQLMLLICHIGILWCMKYPIHKLQTVQLLSSRDLSKTTNTYAH